MKTLLLLLSLLILSSQTPLSHSIRCNPQDKKVLLKIKQDFNNPYHLASWDPTTDCCYWYIVKCDRKTNRINQFHLFTANISGQIPPSIGDLPYLEYLTIHKITNLTGSIPPSITKLTNLKYLTISWTNISGPIPPFLSQMNNLTSLDLSFNNFSGAIPESLSQLRNLDFLSLDRNKLTGSIPESFGGFAPSLQGLLLSHNQLSGMVPRALGDLNLTTLELQRNRLNGDVSFLFGKNKTIQNADLSRNMLEFDVSNVEFPASLRTLDLNHNRITGRLPDGMTELYFLNVSYNRLCGRIPVGGRLQELDYTCYFHNKCLCGLPLPDCKWSLRLVVDLLDHVFNLSPFIFIIQIKLNNDAPDLRNYKIIVIPNPSPKIIKWFTQNNRLC